MSHATKENGSCNRADATAGADGTHVTSLSSRLEPLCIVSGQSCNNSMQMHVGTTYLMMAALGSRTGGDYYKLRGSVTAPWARWGVGQGGVQCCRSRAGGRASAGSSARQVGGDATPMYAVNKYSTHRLSGSTAHGPTPARPFQGTEFRFSHAVSIAASRVAIFFISHSRRGAAQKPVVLSLSSCDCACRRAPRRACCLRLDR